MSGNLHVFAMAAPLLTAFFVNIMGRFDRKWVPPLVFGSLSLSTILTVLLMGAVIRNGPSSYTVGAWIPPWGIELVVDHLSALMLLLIAAVSLVASISSYSAVSRELPGREHLFFTLYLILIAGLMGLVLTADAFNLYVLLEITSITTYGLIAMGRGRAPLASFNYIIMGSIGACFYLLGVGYLYLLTGTLNMADIAQYLPGLQGSVALASAFAFIFVGLWIKMAFFPLHGWLPGAYSLAPTGAAVLIAPLMTKVTVYLMVRLVFVFSKPGITYIAPEVQSLIVWGASAAIFCASFLALGQRDLKKMLTYIIVAEVGYMVGGIWLANIQGMTGTILHIVNDALMTLCLFLAVAAITHRVGSLRLENLSGIYRRMPWTMAAFTLGAFAMIGVPPTCGFFSKWYLVLGGIEAGQWGYVTALIFSSLINAVLFFRIIEIAFFGGENGQGAVSREEAPMSLLQPLLIAAAALVIVGLGTGPLVENVIRLAIPGGY